MVAPELLHALSEVVLQNNFTLQQKLACNQRYIENEIPNAHLTIGNTIYPINPYNLSGELRFEDTIVPFQLLEAMDPRTLAVIFIFIFIIYDQQYIYRCSPSKQMLASSFLFQASS